MNRLKKYRIASKQIDDNLNLQKFDWQVYLMIRFNNSIDSILTKLKVEEVELEKTINELIKFAIIEEVTYSFDKFCNIYYPDLNLDTTKKDTSFLQYKDLKKFVNAKFGTGKNSDMAIYRIFLSIPTSVLKNAGINSFQSIENDFPLTNKELLTFLDKATKKVLGTSLTKGVN